MDRYELRREDYSLSADQADLQSAFRKFFAAHCPIEMVRAAEPEGFDKSLWERLCGTGRRRWRCRSRPAEMGRLWST